MKPNQAIKWHQHSYVSKRYGYESDDTCFISKGWSLFGIRYYFSGDTNDFLGLIDMYDSEKQEWVDTHNYYRRQVFNPEAANMKLMTWDDELAEFAENVVKTCAHVNTAPGDRKTSVFSVIGENLFTGGTFRLSEMMTKDGISKLWYDEVRHYDFTTTSCASGNQCGEYTQVAWANTYKIGCAIAACRAVEYGYPPYLVCCNYGPAGNLVLAGGPADLPYISGKACTQCEVGDLCIDRLCNNTIRDIAFTTTTVEPTTISTAYTTTTASPTKVATTTVEPTIRHLRRRKRQPLRHRQRWKLQHPQRK